MTDKISPTPEVLSVHEAADLIGISLRRAYRWIDRDHLTATRVAGRYVVFRSEVDRHLNRARAEEIVMRSAVAA